MKQYSLAILALMLVSFLCGCNGTTGAERETAATIPFTEAIVETTVPYEYPHLYDDQEAVASSELLYALGLLPRTGMDISAMDMEKPLSYDHAISMLSLLWGMEDTGAPSETLDAMIPAADGETPVEAPRYMAAVLHALGYREGEDYQLSSTWDFAKQIGLADARYDASTQYLQLGDAVVIANNAISLTCKNTDQSLLSYIRENLQPTVDFAALLEEVSAEHKTQVENNAELESAVKQYLVENKEDVNLLTKEEIEDLITKEDSPLFMTYEEAAYDVDVLFRAFRSAYGAYYYFGEEYFEVAKAEVMDWLEGQSKLKPDRLREKLTELLLMLPDAHTCIQPAIQEQPLRHKYYYTDLIFAKDDAGYYRYEAGEKWHVDSFADSRVKMEYRLTAEGEIVYSPVLFCLPTEIENSIVTLKNAAGNTRKETLKWVLSQPYGESYRTPDFKLLEENGIAYLSVRCFDPKYEKGELAEFIASGTEVRDAKLIIFDIRSNGGGRDNYCMDWVEKYCGEKSQYAQVMAKRISNLRNKQLTNDGMYPEYGTVGTYRLNVAKGKQLANEIPIIILVDDTCGSAGEGMMNYTRCLDNVMIVGSNSGGYQLCGNQTRIFLPVSNVECNFGTSLSFVFSDENVDYKGYEPDVWCNPVDALDAVVNMLLRYDLTDTATWQSLKSNLAG